MVTYIVYCIVSVHILFFNLKKNEIFLLDRKVKGGSKPSSLWGANYGRENNDYMNALRPRRF